MSLTRTRTTALMSGAALGALLLAGCSGAEEEAASPSPTVDAQQSASTQPGDAPELPQPDPDATGTSEVESLEGTLSAQVPNAWGQYPAESAAQAAQDPSVTDVLGLWIAGDTPETQHSVVVMGQVNEQPELDAQGYYDTYFADVDDPSVDISHEIFTNSTDREVLFLSVATGDEAEVPEENLFVVFDEEQLVIGLMSAPGQMDDGLTEDLRAVADSIAIA